MDINRPNIIVRETKILAEPLDIPVNQKFTFQNANEDKNKINAAIDMLPIFLVADEDGILTGYEVTIGQGDDEETVNILTGKSIGAIIQIGSIGSFPEYDPILEAGPTMFSKEPTETTIMQPATNIPMIFLPYTSYLLFPR